MGLDASGGVGSLGEVPDGMGSPGNPGCGLGLLLPCDCGCARPDCAGGLLPGPGKGDCPGDGRLGEGLSGKGRFGGDKAGGAVGDGEDVGDPDSEGSEGVYVMHR